MTAYKPSGWTACDPGDYSDYDGRSIVILDDWKRVAVVIGDGSRSKTDARLIAAAPILLGQHEADIVDLELLAKAIHAGDPMPELVIRVTDMLNRKRAAISKATGATP